MKPVSEAVAKEGGHKTGRGDFQRFLCPLTTFL
jgi:hypothetical protein